MTLSLSDVNLLHGILSAIAGPGLYENKNLQVIDKSNDTKSNDTSQ